MAQKITVTVTDDAMWDRISCAARESGLTVEGWIRTLLVFEVLRQGGAAGVAEIVNTVNS